MVSIPLKNISQLGWLFPIYGKKNVPNHQPEVVGDTISDNLNGDEEEDHDDDDDGIQFTNHGIMDLLETTTAYKGHIQ